MTTFLGENFTPVTPNPDQIHIKDIAHALSLLCRANGHFIRFYSVAQHAINCAQEAKARGLSPHVQLACLLHDASEAYLADIVKPLKVHLPSYQVIENRLQTMIYEKYLTKPLTDIEQGHIAQIDRVILLCEFKELMKKPVFDEVPDVMSKPSLEFRDFQTVEDEFLAVFEETKRAQEY